MIKNWLRNFMIGRYGPDQLNIALLVLSLVLSLVGIFVRTNVINIIGNIVLIYMLFRMFSRNVQKRYQENCVYYRYVNKVKDFFKRQKSYLQQSKTHHIYKCPTCKQKIRIPRGKGKVAIRCQKCGTEFIKNSR